MSEELTKDQLNLVKVLNYCLETKHDFAGARSNKNTKIYAKEVIDCINLPPILKKDAANFQGEILSEFGLDVDSIQRDNYMESEMVKGVFLNPKTYNPKVSLEENLEVFAYNHAIKYTDSEQISGSSPENLYNCKIVMGELELDRDDPIKAEDIFDKINKFIGDSDIIVDTIPSNFSYLYNKLINYRSKQPFTKDWDPATLTGNELTDEELSKNIKPANDVRKIYNQASVNVLKDFSKKVLNIVPVYWNEIEGNNQTKDCSSDNAVIGSNYCIIPDKGINKIPDEAQLLLLFKSEDNVDFTFNIGDVNDTYKLPLNIEGSEYKQTYITSGYSVKELSSGIGLFVGLRNELDNLTNIFNTEECNKIKTEIKKLHDRSNKLDKKGLVLAWNIIDGILNNKESLKYKDKPITVDYALQYGILIMLDLKKAGDWGLVDYCRRTNSVLLTVDRLCGLYALINNVSTIFSGSFYPDYKTWVIFKGDTNIKPKTGSALKLIIKKNINDFNKSVNDYVFKIDEELKIYKKILNDNCVDVNEEPFKPIKASKFKDASVKFEYLKKIRDIYRENHITIDEIDESLALDKFIDTLIKDIKKKLVDSFENRSYNLFLHTGDKSLLYKNFEERHQHIKTMLSNIKNMTSIFEGDSYTKNVLFSDNDDITGDDSEKIKFNTLKVGKNLISSIDDIFNIVRLIHHYYNPCNDNNCSPDYANLIHNYRMRILSIFMYPKSRQSIIGKKVISRDGIADKYQEITRAFEENLHRTRVSMIDKISNIDFMIGFYENDKVLPFWEIFSNNFEKIVSEFQINNIFDFNSISSYLSAISDRDRTTAINNLISSYSLLHKNTYPGKAILSIKNINKFLKTKVNILSKKKVLTKDEDGVITESLLTLDSISKDDINIFIKNLKSQIYDPQQQNSIVSMIFFITIFIDYCKTTLIESYSDQDRVNDFENKIDILVNTEDNRLIKDLILVLFSDDVFKDIPTEFSSEQNQLITDSLETINSWLDDVNEEYDIDNFEKYLDTKYEVFYKNFEDTMDNIHFWRTGSPSLFCNKKLGSFFKKYPHLDIGRFKKAGNTDSPLLQTVKDAYIALKNASSVFNIKKCNKNSVINLIRTLGCLILLTSNQRSKSGQEIEGKPIYKGIFFTKDPVVMRKLNNLESIQKKYIDVLQNLYNIYIPEDEEVVAETNEKLISLCNWDKKYSFKNCKTKDNLFEESVRIEEDNEHEGDDDNENEQEVIGMTTMVQHKENILLKASDENFSICDDKEGIEFIDCESSNLIKLKEIKEQQLEILNQNMPNLIEEQESEHQIINELSNSDITIQNLHNIGRKGMLEFIKEKFEDDSCMVSKKSDCNESCVWINFDHQKRRNKSTQGKCISREKFDKIPKIDEIKGVPCCSYIRREGCEITKCIDLKYQEGGSSVIDSIIALENDISEINEAIELLNDDRKALIVNNTSADIVDRKNSVKKSMKIKDNIEIYDINCSILSEVNCGKSNDTIFSLCKLDNNVCIRDEDKHLDIEYIMSGDIDKLQLESKLSSEQIKLIKYLVMNINLYENCEYGDEKIDSLDRSALLGNNLNESHQNVKNSIMNYINSNILNEKILTSIEDIVDYVSNQLISLNSADLNQYIDGNTDKKVNKYVLKGNKNTSDYLIIYLSGIVNILRNDSNIVNYINNIIKSNYTNSCDVLNFKRGAKNIFDSEDNIVNLDSFNINETNFMIDFIRKVESERPPNLKLKPFFSNVTRQQSSDLKKEIENLTSKDKEKFIADYKFIGKLSDSMEMIDYDGNIDQSSKIYDSKFYKLADIEALTKKIRVYLDYYPAIKDYFRETHPQYIIDGELYFENIIILPYMNAAFILLLYYPVIKHLVNDRYIVKEAL